jgi:hypothetical protein
MQTTLDHERNLYIFNHGSGYSCRGFESLFNETNALAKKLKRPDLEVPEAKLGSLEVLDMHQSLLKNTEARLS